MTLKATRLEFKEIPLNKQKRVDWLVFELGEGVMKEMMWDAKLSRWHLNLGLVNKTLKCYLLCLLTSSFDFVQPNLLHHSHIAIIRALIYGEIAKRGCFRGYLLLTAK
jgi:hypothetical protein